uniref:Helicase ATP-binding domain-containing protein n=1 Tax=Meloidogyne hapla TaxID=6305 RepID=A0A1I8BK20_MELHA
MDIEQQLEELREEKAKQQRIQQRLAQIRQEQKEFRESGIKKNRKIRRGKRSRSIENDLENAPPSSSDIITLGDDSDNDFNRRRDRDLLLSDSEEEGDEKKVNSSINGDPPESEPVLRCNKLIYASRTHSQLEQFVKELQKTNFKPRVLTLGSRQMLCVNEEVRELGEGKLINDRCNELLSSSGKNTEEGKRPKMECEVPKSGCGCYYAKGDAIEELSDAILAVNEDEKFIDQARGIAQLVKLGRQRHGCPYYASKTALGLSQLILVPYNILLHKRTRQAWNLDLMGNVIIVDEAHNLLQTLASIHTVELSNNQLDTCCQCLSDYMEHFQDRLSFRNLRNVKQLHCLAFSMYQFLGSIIREKGQSTDGTVINMAHFFSQALTSRSEDARIVIDRTNIKDPRLRFILLNPAEKLRDIVNECRSLILLGGTMRPVDQLMDAFKRVCKIPQQRIKVFSCGHVIGPKQLLAISIGKGPDDKPLSLNFANRDSESVLRSLAQSFINLIRQIPNGVVAFFPSYVFLGTFIRSIRSSGHYEQLERRKEIFIETRAGKEESVWPAFCRAAVTQRGALLMAVVGGKLSEGINFSDELGRCVLMVGVPYPNRQSAELQERMKFVEQTNGKGAGNRFYEQLCLQSLNQAIGRVIRHKNDYAVILLLDQRFTQQFLGNGLPNWIKQRLINSSNFPEALGALIKFFRLHKTEKEEKELKINTNNCKSVVEINEEDDDIIEFI